MNDIRLENELKHLTRLKNILDKDTILPIRFEIQKKSLDFRTFSITITGIKSLIKNPKLTSNYSAQRFNTTWNIPIGYPWTRYPNIIFVSPIPYHPHIYTSGAICWGSLSGPQPDYALADWFRFIIEFLVINENSLMKINTNSPANHDATKWWKSNNYLLYKYITRLDMPRLRFWIDRTRG